MIVFGFLPADGQWFIMHAVILRQEWTNEP